MGFDDLVTRQQGGSPPSPAFLAESRASHMLVGNILVQTVGCIFVFMRVYSRLVIIKTWRLEDWVLVVAWLCATGFSVCQYGQIHHGAGRHLIALLMGNPRDPVESQKFAYAGQIVIFPALALPKLSICLAYLRIFFNDKKGRRMIQVLMVFLVLVIVPFDVEVILQCNPIHVYWTEGRPQGKCINDAAGFYISGTVNVLVDMALMAIVLPRILELQLHRRQRWALIAVVSLGSLAIVAGITRMVRIGTVFSKPNFDPSWDAYDVSIWTSTEIYVTLICASAPGIKPFVKQALPKLLGTSMLSRTRRTGPTGNTYELGSKWKRNTTTSSKTLRRQESETALAAAAGPYTECGRGVDAESLGDRSGMNNSWKAGGDDGAIYKTSEIHIRTTPA